MSLDPQGTKRQYSYKLVERLTSAIQPYQELPPSDLEELNHEKKPNKRFKVTSETLNNLIIIDDDLALADNQTINQHMVAAEKVNENSNQGDMENPSIEDTNLASLQTKKDTAYHNDPRSDSDIDMYEVEPANFSKKSDGSNDRERSFLKLFDTMLESTPGKIRLLNMTQKTIHQYSKIVKPYITYCARENLKSFDVDGKTVLEWLRNSHVPNIAKKKGIDPK